MRAALVALAVLVAAPEVHAQPSSIEEASSARRRVRYYVRVRKPPRPPVLAHEPVRIITLPCPDQVETFAGTWCHRVDQAILDFHELLLRTPNK